MAPLRSVTRRLTPVLLVSAFVAALLAVVTPSAYAASTVTVNGQVNGSNPTSNSA